MTSGKTIIYIVMSAVGVSLIPAAALAVPVVPNFTQGSMTSHTETTSKVTETINSIDYLSLIHISEPTRRTPISYAVLCLKIKRI